MKDIFEQKGLQDQFVIIPNSAGYAIDAIGMVANWAKYKDFTTHLMADERLAGLIANITNANIQLSVPYGTTLRFDPSTRVTKEQQQHLQALGISKEQTTTLEQIAEETSARIPLVDTPAGHLPARPFQWMNPDEELKATMAQKLTGIIQDAREVTGNPNAEPVFMFYWGGKPVTDTEGTPDARAIGGALKSVPARLIAEQISAVQKRDGGNDAQVIIPIFAQYGAPDKLDGRMEEHNNTYFTGNVPRAQRIVDWNGFEGPAALISAMKNYKFIAAGNLNTTHHLFCAAGNLEAGQRKIIGAENAYVHDKRWHAASAEDGPITVLKGDNKVGRTYEELLKLAPDDPETVVRIIKESNVWAARGLHSLMSEIALPRPRLPYPYPNEPAAYPFTL